jgi:tetratricopeptide (TPR) repeat protein
MSLLDVSGDPEEAKPRYNAHSLMRAFAGAKLQEHSNFEQKARQREAVYYEQLLLEYQDDWVALPHLEEEINNVLDCAWWCQRAGKTQLMASLTTILWEFCHGLGMWDEYITLTTAAVDACRARGDQGLLKKALHGLAAIAYYRDQWDESEQLVLEEKQIAHTMGDIAGVAQAYQNLGQIAGRRDAYDEAEAFLQQALEIAQRLGDQHRIMAVERCLAWIALREDNLPKARALFEKVATRADRSARRDALHGLARVLRLQGDESHARLLLVELQEGFTLSSHTHADIRWEYALLEAATGNREEALAYAHAAYDLFHRLGMHRKEKEAKKLIMHWEKTLT